MQGWYKTVRTRAPRGVVAVWGSGLPPPPEPRSLPWVTGNELALDARPHFANFRGRLRPRPTARAAGANLSVHACRAGPRVRLRRRSRSRPSLEAPQPRRRVGRVWSDRRKPRRRRRSREPERMTVAVHDEDCEQI